MHGLYQKCQWSLQAKKLHYKNKCYRSGAGEFGDPPMTRNGELHLCWRPLFLLRCLWNKVPSQRRPTAPVRPSPQGSQSWKCIYASVKPSEIKYHPCAKRFVIFPLQLWLTGGRGRTGVVGLPWDGTLFHKHRTQSHLKSEKKKQNEASQGSLRALLSFQPGDVRGHPRITSHQPKQQNNKTTKHPIIGTKRSAEKAETYDYPFCVGTDYSLVQPLLFWCGFCFEKTQGNSVWLLSRSPVPAEVTQQ